MSYEEISRTKGPDAEVGSPEERQQRRWEKLRTQISRSQFCRGGSIPVSTEQLRSLENDDCSLTSPPVMIRRTWRKPHFEKLREDSQKANIERDSCTLLG